MPNDDIAKLAFDRKMVGSDNRWKRRRGLTIVILLLLVVGVLTFRFYLSPSIPIEAATVSLQYPSSSFTLLNASGYVVAQRKASLAAKATGRLEWLGVEEGSRVKKGDIIARLESRDVEASQRQAIASLMNAKALRDQAKVDVLDATKNLERITLLYSQGILSQADYDTARFRFEKGKSALAAAEASINVAEAALAAAEVVLDYTRIRAPFDGVVLTKNADVGDIVTPLGAAANAKASVVTLADLDSLKAEVDVSESNINKVRTSQPCEILLDSLPQRRFRGEVHSIVPTADRSKATVMVKVGFIDHDPGIMPEMSAKVAFLERAVKELEKNPNIVVARNAITDRSGKTVVFLVRGDRVVEVPVEKIDMPGEQVAVRKGVSPGDKVVLNPPAKLKNGSRIKIIQK
jgi:RND family efflux transporter MFP subunit